MLSKQPELTEAMKNDQFHSHFRKDALQTFRNNNACNKRTLEEVLILFRQKYVRPQSQATAKHKWHKLTFEHNTKSLSNLLEKLIEMCRTSFWTSCTAKDRQFLICKITSTSQTVNQPSLYREWHIRTDSYSLRKRT